jgi:hypothetical protein
MLNGSLELFDPDVVLHQIGSGRVFVFFYFLEMLLYFLHFALEICVGCKLVILHGFDLCDRAVHFLL